MEFSTDFILQGAGQYYGRKNAVEAVAADISVRAIPGVRRELLDVMTDAANKGAARARSKAPQAQVSDNPGARLKDAIEVQGEHYRAGGAGGGGTYTTSFGVRPDQANKARWLIEGTGIYRGTGIFDAPSGRPIRPLHAQLLRWPGRGKYRIRWPKTWNPDRYDNSYFAPEIKGQAPQDFWWIDAIGHAELIVSLGLRDIEARNQADRRL